MDKAQERDEKIAYLTEEQPAQTGSVKWDYRLGWGAVTVFVGITGLFFAAKAAGSPILGLLFLMLCVAGYVLFVFLPLVDGESKSLLTSITAKAIREVYDLAGWKIHNADEAMVGDGFIAKNQPAPMKPRKVAKLVGRIEVKPYVGEDDSVPSAVTHDRRLGTYSTTLWVNGTPLTSLTPQSIEYRTEAFAKGIDWCNPVGTPITRLAWRTQTFLTEPIDTDLARRFVGRPGDSNPSIGILNDVAAEISQKSPQHLTTMTLTVDAKSVGRRRSSGGPEDVLMSTTNDFVNVLKGEYESLVSASMLSYNQTVGMMRTLSDPVYVERVNPRLLGSHKNLTLESSLALPGYFNFSDSRDMARVGMTYHKYYYVTTLDRTPVGIRDFTLLHLVRIPKVVTNVVMVLPRKKALRRARFSANAAYSGQADKGSDGARISSVDRLLAEETERVEADIVQGKHLFARERIYIDVAGSSVLECEAYDRILKAALARTNLVLEPMIDRHAEALRASLLIGAGLESISAADYFNLSD